MASNLNDNNQQRGTPAPTDRAGGNPQRRQQRPRARTRDIQRMSAFNERMHNEQFGSSNWANQVTNAIAEEDAFARPPPPIRRSQQFRRRGQPPAPVTVQQTAPRDELLYVGNGRGSKPVKTTLGHNFDCAGFVPLVRQVYDRICIEDSRIPRSLPYPMFQHAMTEFLVAYQLHQGKYALKVPSLQSMMDPLSAISAEDFNIPVPIYEYICGFCPAVTPTGDKVFWNLPDAAIPKGSIELHGETVRSGTFGDVSVESHNAYECYVSPFITSEYIKISRSAEHRTANWNPFPTGWFPASGSPNENLLGYREKEYHHPDAIRRMSECTFDETDAITGRLCHSAQVLTVTSGVLGTLKDVKICKADFKMRENPAAFIYKEFDDGRCDPSTVLWDTPSTLKSPFSFSASASNRANFMAYKRKRSENTPGPCYTVNGNVPTDWNTTRNYNFENLSTFKLQPGFKERVSLQESHHEEEFVLNDNETSYAGGCHWSLLAREDILPLRFINQSESQHIATVYTTDSRSIELSAVSYGSHSMFTASERIRLWNPDNIADFINRFECVEGVGPLHHDTISAKRSDILKLIQSLGGKM